MEEQQDIHSRAEPTGMDDLRCKRLTACFAMLDELDSSSSSDDEQCFDTQELFAIAMQQQQQHKIAVLKEIAAMEAQCMAGNGTVSATAESTNRPSDGMGNGVGAHGRMSNGVTSNGAMGNGVTSNGAMSNGAMSKGFAGLEGQVPSTAQRTADVVMETTGYSTGQPLVEFTSETTAQPTEQLADSGTAKTTAHGTAEPTAQPTAQRRHDVTAEATAQPTAHLALEATAETTAQPTAQPTAQLTARPPLDTTARAAAGTVLGFPVHSTGESTGQPEIEDYVAATTTALDTAQPTAHLTAQRTAQHTVRGVGHASISARPQTKPVLDLELEAFKAELNVLEGVEPSVPSVEPVEVSTPPPDERSFEDDDGTIYVWDVALRKFVPQLEPAAPTYEQADMTYVAEEEVIPSLAQLQEQQRIEEAQAILDAAVPSGKKRGAVKEPGNAQEPDKKKAKGQPQSSEPEGWFELKNNTSVYVDGLPDDVTVEEILEVFGKCGLIKEDDQGKPRIKLYMDKARGVPKGDALVTFLKAPSVELAVRILDGTPIRYGAPKNMCVSQAQFSMKGDKYVPKSRPTKKEAKKQLEKLERRLHWGGFDDRAPAEKVTVIMRGMFRLEEFAESPDFEKELEEDISLECGKVGAVEKVRVFSTNPAGVVSVRFKEPEHATACIKLMNGRWFGGQQIQCHMWDGVANYHIKPRDAAEDEARRLEEFARSLEAKP